MMKNIPKVMAIIVLSGLLTIACKNPSVVPIIGLSAKEARPLIEENRGNPDFILLDIRTPREYAQGHIPNAILLDYYHPSFKDKLRRLDRNKTYFIYCRSGNRSSRTLNFIQTLGFKKIYHLSNGMIDWNRENYPLATS